MFGKWLPQLSPTAQSLLANERSEREDEALQERALERARAALEGERWSGVQMRQAGEAATWRWGSLRTAVLVAAALAIAGLATAGVRLAVSEPSHGAVAAVAKAPAPPLRRRPIEPSVVRAPAPQPESAAPAVAGTARTSLLPTSAAPPANAVTPTGTAHVRPSIAETYAIEVGLLEPARVSIARGDYVAALSALGRHQREYPNGQLSQEREALRVRALWGSGQKPAAEAAAAAFRRRYPQSGLLSWMKPQPAP